MIFCVENFLDQGEFMKKDRTDLVVSGGDATFKKKRAFKNKREFIEKLAAVLRQHSHLAPEWDDDQPAIAQHLGVSTGEYKRLLRKYGHSGTGHGSRLGKGHGASSWVNSCGP